MALGSVMLAMWQTILLSKFAASPYKVQSIRETLGYKDQNDAWKLRRWGLVALDTPFTMSYYSIIMFFGGLIVIPLPIRTSTELEASRTPPNV